MSWTSKGRIPSARRAPSRATAKAGTRISSKAAFSSGASARRRLNSSVLARNPSSESAWICGSISLMAATIGSIFLTSR